MPPGIPIQSIIAPDVTSPKSGTVNVQATYSRTMGSEICPKMLCAIFHVSSSRMVQGSRNPVCRLYGILGHRIPDASMIQLIKDIANIFSPFSENVITSSAVRQATRIPIIKNPILISVVTRRVPIRRSSVVSFVNRARLRYKMMAALIMHIPVNRRDTSSFFTINATSMAKNVRNKIVPLFLPA